MHSDFDVAAPQYDDIFTYSNIGKAQRKLVFKHINPIIKSRKKTIYFRVKLWNWRRCN